MASLKFEKKNINFTDEGTGKAVVLLHGFTESLKMWSGFTAGLSKKYRVVCIDLPGHGKSDNLGKVNTMAAMADAVFFVLKNLRIGKCLMVGHSMGGYVTLAFAAKFPKRLKGLTLFHSHCFPDNSAEKENRSRTVAIVGQDKFNYVAQFIPSLFPIEVHKKFSKQIEQLIQRASKMEKEGLIAALEGMKERADQSELLKTLPFPLQFVIGQKDTRAPLSRLGEMISLPAVSETLLLRECGHMGHIENPETTLSAITTFAKKVL